MSKLIKEERIRRWMKLANVEPLANGFVERLEEGNLSKGEKGLAAKGGNKDKTAEKGHPGPHKLKKASGAGPLAENEEEEGEQLEELMGGYARDDEELGGLEGEEGMEGEPEMGMEPEMDMEPDLDADVGVEAKLEAFAEKVAQAAREELGVAMDVEGGEGEEGMELEPDLGGPEGEVGDELGGEPELGELDEVDSAALSRKAGGRGKLGHEPSHRARGTVGDRPKTGEEEEERLKKVAEGELDERAQSAALSRRAGGTGTTGHEPRHRGRGTVGDRPKKRPGEDEKEPRRAKRVAEGYDQDALVNEIVRRVAERILNTTKSS